MVKIFMRNSTFMRKRRRYLAPPPNEFYSSLTCQSIPPPFPTNPTYPRYPPSYDSFPPMFNSQRQMRYVSSPPPSPSPSPPQPEPDVLISRTTPYYRKPGRWIQRFVISSLDQFDDVWAKIYPQLREYKAVGFDVECVNFANMVTFNNQQMQNDKDVETSLVTETPSLRLPVKVYNDKGVRKESSVLLQLATWTGYVFLFRLCYMECIPEPLLNFLADPSILKLGVAVEIDACRLHADWGIVVRGWLDLRHICCSIGVQFHDICFIRMGLKNLATTLFGESEMLKTNMKRVSFSDWTVPKLNKFQLNYASWDVQIAIDIFSYCTQKLFNVSPPLINDPIYFATVFNKCNGYIESKQDDEISLSDVISLDDELEDDSCELDKFAKLLDKFNAESSSSIGFSHASANRAIPKSHGKNVLSLEAVKLFGLNSLCELEIVAIDIDENLIRLYLPPWLNGEAICVVCGEKDFAKCCLIPVVPPAYSSQNDIDSNCLCNEIWLCHMCRDNWMQNSFRLTLELAVIFDAPMGRDVKGGRIVVKSEIASFSNSFVVESPSHHMDISGFDRINVESSSSTIRYFDDSDDISEEGLVEKSHEFLVMKHFADRGEFEHMWRTHFLQMMQPRFITDEWSEEHDSTQCDKKDECKSYFLRKSSMITFGEGEFLDNVTSSMNYAAVQCFLRYK